MIVKKKKYIIELPENTHWIQWIMEGTKDHHPYMDYKQVEDLIPYTEPDLEQVRKDYDAFYEHGYEQGLADAWEAARTLWNTPNRKEIFGHTTFNTVLTTLTAQEAIEKIRQYEQEKEKQEKLKKEQSVTAEDVMRQYLDTFCSKCRGCGACILNTPDFTCGRGYHFLTNNRVSDEEVRRAYAEVCKR